MVVEREPPKPATLSMKQDQWAQQTVDLPQFGETTSLQNPLRTSVFNVPKPHQSRPEHHRSKPPTAQHEHLPGNEGGRGLVDPFEHRLATHHRLDNSFKLDQDVVEIPRPVNASTWKNYIVAPPTYSSLGSGVPNLATLNPYPKPIYSGALVDLTSNTLFDDRFGSADPYEYVDAEKTVENIKALLEGAFEDEEDKPKTRGRKNKLEAKATKLTNKLQGLSVKPEEVRDKEPLEEEDEGEEKDDDDDGTIEGLNVKLLPHQVEGVDWMVDKEAGVKKKNAILPKGGILADDMGLGKTIQSISVILMNPRPPISTTDQDEKHKISSSVGKSTLVVAPLALIKQWEAEIKNRVSDSHKLRVCVHHGPQRTKHSQDLKKYDVVITTYQILVSECGRSFNSDDGPQAGCFGIHWYRVILDEAHTIKNRNAKTTQACYALRAEYRWCLTGTPMQNNLDELQSLIKFLRIKPYNELPVWRDQITHPMANGRGGVAMKRLQFYLKAFMKRRTKDILKAQGALNPGGKVDVHGQATNGFKITERRIEKIVAEFSPREQSFYDRLEQRAGKSLDDMMSGEAMNYASALVLLLRLRQACNHPKLMTRNMANDRDALTTGQESGNRSPRKANVVDKDLDEMANLLGGLIVQTKNCDVCQTELKKGEASNGSIRCAECEADLAGQRGTKIKKPEKPLVKKVQTGKLKHQVAKNRRVVFDSDDDEDEGDWVVPKGQRKTLELGRAGGSEDENAEGGGEWLASDDSDAGDEASIQTLGSDKKKVISLDTTDEEGDITSSVNANHQSRHSESEGASDDEEENEIPISDKASSKSIVTSTKIQCLLRLLHRESATNKFIVFSQFTSMLDLIEPFLRRDGLVFTRYDGSMRNDLREASLERLRNNKKTRILLCSLKCGSLGLNLTAASRVVILEPFWNPFVEEQAIDRVHRLNQTLDVIVYKITIAKSVEERILELQDKKRFLAEAAIEGKAIAKLSLQDMLNLFKRDDMAHDADVGLGAKRSVLHAPSQIGVKGKSSVRSTPPIMGKGRGSGSREDSIYARRWG